MDSTTTIISSSTTTTTKSKKTQKSSWTCDGSCPGAFNDPQRFSLFQDFINHMSNSNGHNLKGQSLADEINRLKS